MDTHADTKISSDGGARLAGVLAIGAGVGALGLLALHPAENAHTFAEIVAEEARNVVPNAIVHGGFIGVNALQLIAYGVLSSRLGRGLASRAAFTFFAIGAAWLCLSMLFDGLVMPAVATRYVAQPDKIESARPIFALVGSIVRSVMPLGQGFIAAAILAWSAAMFANRLVISGAIALLLGAALALAVYLGAFGGMMMAMMGAFVLMALWSVSVGVVLLRK